MYRNLEKKKKKKKKKKMGMKKCELCGAVARMFCESDQANLCWDCDAKVHGANFLVAKHTRCLLCSACQSPTPWKASGLRLAPTVSICQSCVARKNTNRGLNQEINAGGDRLSEDDGAESYNDDDEEEESDEDEDEEEEEEEEEEAENQVVPWDAAAAAQQPPLMSSSSSVSNGDGGLMAKRTRQDSDLDCSDEESNQSRPSKRSSRDESSSTSTAILRLSSACDTSSTSLVFKTRDLDRSIL